MTTAETIADSVWGKLLARYGTPMLLVVVLWFGGNYLTVQAEALKAQARRSDMTDAMVNALDRRLVMVETNQTSELRTSGVVIARLDNKLDNLASALSDLRAQVAALTAKLELLSRRDRAEVMPGRP